MSSSNNIRTVELRWTGEDLVFHGTNPQGAEVIVDSASKQGASPMQLLLLSVAGCMGIDVKLILDKSRVPLETMVVRVTGERALSDPKKFEKIELVYELSGPAEADQAKLQRAIDLSREKYCSVLHTLDPAIEVEIRVERA